MTVHLHLSERVGPSGTRSFGLGVLHGYELLGIEPRIIPSWGSRLMAEIMRLPAQDTYHSVETFDFLPTAKVTQVITILDLFLLSRLGGASAIVRTKCRALLALVPRSAIISCISEQSRLSLPRHLASRALVQRPGVSPILALRIATATHDRRAVSEPYFLYSGGRHERKRLDLLLASFGNYRRQGGTASLVSTAVLDAPADLSPHIQIVAGASEDVLANLYLNAIACVYTSNSEGYGLPLLESAMAGRPSLSSCIPAAIEDSDLLQNRILPRDASPTEWARCLLEFEAASDEPNRPTWSLAQNDERWIALAGTGIGAS
jgi:glycosyltransferase involved in cell wall biosynthesis